MDYNKIKLLVEKYLEGETSLEEEKVLQQYFNEEEVAKDLKSFQPLFQYFRQQKQPELHNDFEAQLFSKLEEPKRATVKVKQLNKWKTPWVKIAAAILLLIGGYTIYTQQHTAVIDEPVDKFAAYDATTTQEAYERTKAALMLISNKLDKGKKKTKESLSAIKIATNKIK